MGEHIVVDVNQLSKPEAAESSQTFGSTSSPQVENDENLTLVVDEDEADEHLPLIGKGECRICQEEDSIKNLESPCACSGSLKYAHRKCVQHWCDEKGDITCEICHRPYQPSYTAHPRPTPEESNINVGDVWQLSGTPLDMNDPRLQAIAEAERQLFEGDYEDFHGTHSNGAAFCRSAALILMALLLLRHALSLTDTDGDDGDDDVYTFFSLFLLRVVGFLLPCYIMIWAISILQRRRQRQEAAALAAARLAVAIQAARRRGLLVTPPGTSRSVPTVENV